MLDNKTSNLTKIRMLKDAYRELYKDDFPVLMYADRFYCVAEVTDEELAFLKLKYPNLQRNNVGEYWL